jgi:GTP-binding protein
VLLVVNKVDNNERMLEASEFYSLGFEKCILYSAMSGSGTGDLLDDVTALMEEEGAIEEELGLFPNLPLSASQMWVNLRC